MRSPSHTLRDSQKRECGKVGLVQKVAPGKDKMTQLLNTACPRLLKWRTDRPPKLADITSHHCTVLKEIEVGTNISKLFWDQGNAPQALPCISSFLLCPRENKQQSWVQNGARTFINCLGARALAVASFAVHAGRCSSTKISVKQRCDREINRLQRLSLSYNGFSQTEKCVCKREEEIAVQWHGWLTRYLIMGCVRFENQCDKRIWL